MGGNCMTIYRNDYVELVNRDDRVYITTFKEGFELKSFDQITQMYPRIKLTNFGALKNALATPSPTAIEIGMWLPPFLLEVGRDKMSATITLYELMTPEIEQQIEQELKKNRITFGLVPLNLNDVPLGKTHLIAIGQQPIKGADAQVTYLEIPERKPVIRENGRADYFDMNFIYEIKQGAWLGEKIPPQLGVDGTNVYGETVPAQPGLDAPLLYDPKSAYEVEEDGKIVIRSRTDGAVEQTQGIVGVSSHLTIAGDIGFKTGNVEFEGSVTVSGTISPGFSIIATGDIAIEALDGVSGATKIQSREGDIYIRGGVFGLGRTEIEAGNNIYVKHVNDAIVRAENEIHIGFYSMGSELEAHSIFVNPTKGKIIGGKAQAKSSIEAGFVGNTHERRTEICIDAVNKERLMQTIQEKAAELKELQAQTEQIDVQVKRLTPLLPTLNANQVAAYEELKGALRMQMERAMQLDREVKIAMNELRYAGNEEIYIAREAFPGTIIKIGAKSKSLMKATNGRFKIEFGELNV